MAQLPYFMGLSCVDETQDPRWLEFHPVGAQGPPTRLPTIVSRSRGSRGPAQVAFGLRRPTGPGAAHGRRLGRRWTSSPATSTPSKR